MKKSEIEELGLTENKDVDKLFKERQDERVKLIKESITDIQEMIKDRKELHDEMIDNLSKIDLFIDNTMPKLDALQSGTNPAKSDLLKELMKKKIEIDELKLAEKLNFWRDKALLKKELREHMKEYREMESKTSMLDTLLEM